MLLHSNADPRAGAAAMLMRGAHRAKETACALYFFFAASFGAGATSSIPHSSFIPPPPSKLTS